MNSFLKIKVVGIGGAGVNTVSRIAKNFKNNLELIALNTDAQSLKTANILNKNKFLIGENITFGLGTGMDIKLGEKAAKESEEKLKEILKGADIVFLTYGLGGGSGSGGGPIVAEIAKNLGALTIAVVTEPFSFEGVWRSRVAKLGFSRLETKIDALICVKNDKVLKIIGKNTSVEEAFILIDDVLKEAITSISDLISSSSIISIDFADITELLKNSGRVLFSQAKRSGENRAVTAADCALLSPLVDFSINKAKGILVNVSGRDDLSLSEVQEAINFIKKAVSSHCKIIFGASEDKKLKKGEIKITLIATGIN